MQLVDAERVEPKTVEPRTERRCERARIGREVALDARCRHHADARVPDAAEDERERVRGRTVEPLPIVDREKDRPLRREQTNGRQHGGRDGPRPRRRPRRSGAQQGHLEGEALRHRQPRQHDARDRLEEIRERRKGELRLGLRRPT